MATIRGNKNKKQLQYVIDFQQDEVATIEVLGTVERDQCLHFKLEALEIKEFDFIQGLRILPPYTITVNGDEIIIHGVG